MSNDNNEAVENGFLKVARITVSLLLVVEAVALFIFSSLLLFIAPLMGGLAMAGAGNASDSQIKSGWLMILFMMIAPFVWTAFLGLASLNLFFRKSRTQAMIYSGLAIVGHIGLQLLAKIEFNVTSVLILLVPVAGLIVAAQMQGRSVSSSKFHVPGSPT